MESNWRNVKQRRTVLFFFCRMQQQLFSKKTNLSRIPFQILDQGYDKKF